MSAFLRHRLTFACALILLAQVALADRPAAVNGPRMVYDPRTTYTVLFGGTASRDAATRLYADVDDTWVWVGDRWIHVYPAHHPSGRSLHSMVYDTAGKRILLFGGAAGTPVASGTGFTPHTFLNDLWAYDGSDWTRIDTATAPPVRGAAGAAFDSARNRMIVFGGTGLSADGKSEARLYDTWEFDGTNWRQTSADGPHVDGPILAYDASRGQTLLVGVDTTGKTVMYQYDPAAAAWKQLTPAALPDCVLNANMVYDSARQVLVLFAGTCTTSGILGEVWEWDGTTWTKSDATISRATDVAMAYDALRNQTVLFGGTVSFSVPQSDTFIYKDQKWSTATQSLSPNPRSLAGFVSDPAGSGIWLVSGLTDSGAGADFWHYDHGAWTKLATENGPTGCVSTNAAYDSDRNKLVVVCSDSTTFEWDVAGSSWKQITGLKTYPTSRRFSSMVYDPSIKKTVLFGGWEDLNQTYLDETWLWDGTSWTRQKNKPAPRRSLASMWFDPVLKKTVIFAGIGQSSRDARIERFNDMWSFDGNGWTQITLSGDVPGPRYGAQAAVDPRTNTVILIGGLELEVNGATQTQVYGNDTWQWDGSKWLKLAPATLPPVRENGGFAFDASTHEPVLFGGYGGRFRGDVWSWTGTDWKLRAEALPVPAQPSGRRRTAPLP